MLLKKTGININNSTITQNIQQNIKLLAYIVIQIQAI